MKMPFFDPADFIIKGKLRLKNHTIEHCKMTEMCVEKIEFRMNTFSDVIFENHFKDNAVVIKKCTFVNCSFGGTFGEDSYLEMQDCRFEDCFFQNIRMDSRGEISTISGCKFQNCRFQKINLKGDYEISSLDISGGMMEEIYCFGNEISCSRFSNFTLKNAELNLALYENTFQSVIFRNATFKGCMKLNAFLACDTSGFVFIEGFY